MTKALLLLLACALCPAQTTTIDLSTQARGALSAQLVAGAVKVTCGRSCTVNGYSFANFSGTVSGVPSGTYTAYVYAEDGAVKFGYTSGSAPTVCSSMTCLTGISSMPVDPHFYPIAVVTVSSGTVVSVVDAHNSVAQPDVIVAGSGISSSRSGVTVTLSNSLVGSVSLVTATTATLSSANLYTLVRCNNASGCTLTLPQAGSTSGFVTGTHFWVRNDSASGTLTLSPTTSTINGSSTATVAAGLGAMVWSDGTNYFVI